MSTIVNTSGNNLYIDSLGLGLAAGEQIDVGYTNTELFEMCPDIVLYVARSRVAIKSNVAGDTNENQESP